MVKRKKQFIFLWITLVVLLTAIAFLVSYTISTGTMIPDYMPYYDDGNTGLRTDLWDIYMLQCSAGNSFYQITPEGIINIGCYSNKIVYTDTSYQSSSLLNTYLTSTNGNINLLSTYSPNTLILTSYTTTKKFNTEDIKMTISFDITNVPASNIYYGNVALLSPAYCPANYDGQCRGTLEIKRYDALDLTKYVILFNGIEKSTGTNTEPQPIKLIGTVSLDYLKFQPYYSCEIDRDTEVVVRKTFYSGSEVNITKLKYYNPIYSKFCPNELGVLIYGETGLRKQSGLLLQQIAEGKTVIVPDGEYWEVPYIAPYQTGMQDRDCGVGEFYDENDEKCVSTVQEKEVQEIPVPELKVINNGQNEVTFTLKAGKKIAGKLFYIDGFTVLKDKPECQVAVNNYLSPSSHPNCYEANVIWDKYTFAIKNGETKQLDNHVTVYYELESTGAYYGNKGETFYNYEFPYNIIKNHVFKVSFKDVFNLDVKNYSQTAMPNTIKIICFTAQNNLFELTDSGYNLKITKSIINTFDEATPITKPIIYGTNDFCIDAPTDTLGLIIPEINLYFNMDENNRYISQEELMLPYIVSAEEPPVNPPVQPPVNPQPDYMMTIILIALSLIVLAVIIYLMAIIKKRN